MHENEIRQKNYEKKQEEFQPSRDKLLLIKTERGALIFLCVLLNKTVKIRQTDEGPSSAAVSKQICTLLLQ